MLKIAILIFKSEIYLRCRKSQEWLYPFSFFLTALFIFPFILTPNLAILQPYVPGLIWLAALFASLLSLPTLFFIDLEDDHLTQWLLSPHPFGFLLLSKLSAYWLITQLPIVLLMPLVGWLLHFDLQQIVLLILSLLCGTCIITMLGGLCAALTLGLRQQGIILSLMIMPLIVPVLIFGGSIHSSSALFFLAGIAGISLLLLPTLIALALTISVDT